MTRKELLNWMEQKDACEEAFDWVNSHSLTPEEMWREDKAHFMCWVVGRCLPDLSEVIHQELSLHGLGLYIAPKSYTDDMPQRTANLIRICVPFSEVAEAMGC
ncbi:hypothetical protein LCGC14_1324090 [marine sediment metagenome]|uniref:Uncharacterized protein n=1 Tax=marine sediment metagenome TaxID=412755 RepID=A0A0F9MZH6_9ZZZZ